MFSRLSAIALTFLTTTASLADTVRVDSARGPAEVTSNPETVAVFDVAAADTLNALGVPISGTVDKLFVDYLDEVEGSAEKLGTFWEPDFEGVHALAPDLIVVGSRSADQLDNMAEIAPSIDMTIGTDVTGDALVRLRDYGKIFGKTEQAAAVEKSFTDKLDQARAAAQDKGKVLIVLTNGPKVAVFGADSRFGWMYKDLDLTIAAPEVKSANHGEAISFEFIRESNPDWLIVVDRLAAIGRPGDSAQTTLDNALVQETTAWKSDQVIYLNAADIYVAGGGIQALMRTLDQLTAGFSAG